MLAYIFRRILAMIPTLLGITLITFFIVSLAPGDPVATSFGAGAGAEQSTEAGGGGGQDQDRLADAIRAKKKLLGILEEDRSVIVWSVAGLSPGAGLIPLDPEDRYDDLPGWSRVLSIAAGSLHVGGSDGTITVLSETGSLQAQWEAHESPLTAIARVGDLIISADGEGVIERWTASGESAGQTQPLTVLIREVLPHPDGEHFITAADDGIIRIHRADNGTVTRQLKGHNNRVYAIALTADGTGLWSGGYDRMLHRWDLSTGKIVETIEGHGQAINDIAVSADDSLLVTACDDRLVRIIDRASGEITELSGHYKQASTVAISADSARVYSGSRDETVRVWDVATAAEIAQSREGSGRIRDLDVTADGRLLASGDSWATVPVYRQYLSWLWRTAQLDFDRSFVDDQPVIDKIKRALPVTVGLNALALIVVYTLSIPLGVLAAVKRNSTFDHASSLVLFILYSIPSFWLATLLIMTFSSQQALNVLPSVGLHGPDADNMSYLTWLWDSIKHLIMPVLVMSYGGLASLSRYARTSMLETIGEDYIRTARAKGLEESIVVWKHAFRNSLITIVTLLGNLLPALIGGSVIVEYIFTIQGMGMLGFSAILSRDYPVIMAITTFSALLTLVGILISDILYSIVDPRVTQK